MLLFFLIYASLRAQNDDRPQSHITLSVLSPTLFFSPRWSVGYYKDLNDDFRLGGELGIGTKGLTINQSRSSSTLTQEDYFSIAFAPELMYFMEKTSDYSSFFSIEPFYIYHSDVLNNREYADALDGLDYEYDSARYRRHKFGFNINYGWMIHFGKHLGAIPKVGLGYKTRDVNFSNIENRRPSMLFDDEDGLLGFDQLNYLSEEGRSSKVNLNLEFHLFYAF